MKKLFCARTAALVTGAVLLFYSVFVLLYTFVLPRAGMEPVQEGAYSQWKSATSDLKTGTVTADEKSYKDDHIEIILREYRVANTTVHVADVKLSRPDLLKTAFAADRFGRNYKAVTSEIADANDAIFAVNGDFYGYRETGFVIRNGVLYRTVQRPDTYEDSVLWADGSFSVVSETTADPADLLRRGAVQLFSFGPTLVKDGRVAVSTTEEVAQCKATNPRTAIGYLGDLHYLFVVSDGRTDESHGLTLYELGTFMADLGCSIAYNLDGGGSSTMVFMGQIVNYPTNGNIDGERKVSDIVYIGYR